jgi:hypothetical protein
VRANGIVSFKATVSHNLADGSPPLEGARLHKAWGELPGSVLINVIFFPYFALFPLCGISNFSLFFFPFFQFQQYEIKTSLRAGFLSVRFLPPQTAV